MARILNKSPFDPELLSHTAAQLDFILEMEAEDHPDIYKFERGEKTAASIEIKAAWEKALTGRSKESMLAKAMPSKAVLEKAKNLGRAADRLRMVARASN